MSDTPDHAASNSPTGQSGQNPPPSAENERELSFTDLDSISGGDDTPPERFPIKIF